VPVGVTHNHERLEAHALTGGGLLLHRHDLHHRATGSTITTTIRSVRATYKHGGTGESLVPPYTRGSVSHRTSTQTEIGSGLIARMDAHTCRRRTEEEGGGGRRREEEGGGGRKNVAQCTISVTQAPCLVGQRRADEVLHNLVLLDGDGEEVDVLQGLDLALLHEAAQLGARDPLVGLIL